MTFIHAFTVDAGFDWGSVEVSPDDPMASNVNKLIAASALGLLMFFLSGVVTGIAYVILVGKVLDKGGDGFGLVGALVSFPIFAVMAGVVWLVLWLIHRAKMGPMSAGRTVVLSLIVGLLFSMVVAGPRGFTMAGGSVLFNYFILILVLAGALLTHLVAGKLLQQTAQPVA